MHAAWLRLSVAFFVWREDGKRSIGCRQEGKWSMEGSDFIEAGILNKTQAIYPLVCICTKEWI
jgi:hypothetical protein